jgi:hypothetical protein
MRNIIALGLILVSLVFGGCQNRSDTDRQGGSQNQGTGGPGGGGTGQGTGNDGRPAP